MTTALVTGGREFLNGEYVALALDHFHAQQPITKLVHGAARGADTLAGLWALSRGVPVDDYPVREELDGPWPGAGHARNRRMFHAVNPNVVIAFPGGRGTHGMICYACGPKFRTPLWDLRGAAVSWLPVAGL